MLRRNSLLKHIIEEKKQGGIHVTGKQEKYVSSYWMTLGNGDNTGN
jgi:hypothetical protein